MFKLEEEWCVMGKQYEAMKLENTSLKEELQAVNEKLRQFEGSNQGFTKKDRALEVENRELLDLVRIKNEECWSLKADIEEKNKALKKWSCYGRHVRRDKQIAKALNSFIKKVDKIANGERDSQADSAETPSINEINLELRK